MTNLSKGFVSDATSFVISDDLIVLPHSIDQTIFSLTKNFGIKSTSSVIEITVKRNIIVIINVILPVHL
jgi:hypothetical protein